MLGGVEPKRHRSDSLPKSSRSGARRRASPAVAVGWAAAGFLMGAGFWIYLGAHELSGDGLPLSSSRQDRPETDGGGCTSLTIDRHNRRTTAAPCPGPGQWLRDALTAQLVKPAVP
jgi:hypothetical protein